MSPSCQKRGYRPCNAHTLGVQVLFHEVVQFPQIEIGKILTGEVAAGQSFARETAGKRVSNNMVQQGEQSLVFEFAAEQRLQHGMIDGLVIVAHVALQHIR